MRQTQKKNTAMGGFLIVGVVVGACGGFHEKILGPSPSLTIGSPVSQRNSPVADS